MKNSKLTHVSPTGDPAMVDVSAKATTLRMARAQAIVYLGKEIIREIQQHNFSNKKGSVVQTAILAGIMGAKKTSDLIPLCHPLSLEDCQVNIVANEDSLIIETTARTSGKTGVEMEALTAASVAALTVYDMCKGMSHGIVIKETRLLEKTGGKTDYKHSPTDKSPFHDV